FGSKADICSAQAHVRFTPNSDRESALPQTVMSALPPKADMCGAQPHVCFGPKADSIFRELKKSDVAFPQSCQRDVPRSFFNRRHDSGQRPLPQTYISLSFNATPAPESAAPLKKTGRGRHETPPPHVLASGRGGRRAASRVADRAGTKLSVAAGAH